MFKILIPCKGDDSSNLDNLLKSIDDQIIDSEVECFFLEDEVSKDFRSRLEKSCSFSDNKFLVENLYGKRLYGIFNIVRFLSKFDCSAEKEDPIIGIMDSDDMLWGRDCFQNIKNQYDLGFDSVWTANELKGLGINFSGPLAQNCDVYSHPWVSSHFKTFKLSDFKSVSHGNFKDSDGNWLESCYDQALMLPILHNIFKKGGSTKYIDKVHYIYDGTITPDPDSQYRKSQLENEHFIRSRGYVDE